MVSIDQWLQVDVSRSGGDSTGLGGTGGMAFVDVCLTSTAMLGVLI